MKLRDYQQYALSELYNWFRANPTGNPVMVLPTGSGKSVIIAELCRQAVQSWPETRILMLTSSRELVSQNAARMRSVWPNAPMGVYSAGLNRRELGEPITFAGIQSVASKGADIGHTDLIIVDECHAINHKEDGQYRQLIAGLTEINPHLRVIGLTATPFRLGHGYIHDGDDSIFDDLLESVKISELLAKGHLAPLRSKHTTIEYDTTGVKKSGGDFVVADLERIVDTSEYNHAVVEEMISRASDRKSWLIFCVGVSHAKNIADLLNERGIKTGCVSGKTPSAERKRILEDFEAGRLQAVTNVGVLTTGFDCPRIDMLAMLRPTESTGLYVQCAGRGLRTHPDKTDCLVLDFAGNVSKHGPIIKPKPPKSKGDKKNEDKEDTKDATKVCPKCEEVILEEDQTCPSCGYEYPQKEEEIGGSSVVKLHNDDILAEDAPATIMPVTAWRWRSHTSKASGKEMIAVTYYGKLADMPVTEYIPIRHEGRGGEFGRRLLMGIYKASTDVSKMPETNLHEMDIYDAAATLQSIATPPETIEYTKDGKFFEVKKRNWQNGKSITR